MTEWNNFGIVLDDNIKLTIIVKHQEELGDPRLSFNRLGFNKQNPETFASGSIKK